MMHFLHQPTHPSAAQIAVLTAQHLRVVDLLQRLAKRAATEPALRDMAAEIELVLGEVNRNG